MLKFGRTLALLVGMVGGLLHPGALAARENGSVRSAREYAVIETIDGTPAGGQWDYASLDVAHARLYLAQNCITVLNLATHKVTPHFMSGMSCQRLAALHTILPINGGSILAVSNSAAHTVTFIRSADAKRVRTVTGAELAMAPSGTIAPALGVHDPDSLVYDPATGLLVAVLVDRGELALIDCHSLRVVASIRIGAQLESAVVSGNGRLFVNERAAHSVAFVDMKRRQVIKRVVLQGCEEPTGIAYDGADALVISVCSNGALKFISASKGIVVRTVPVGPGADGLMYEPVRHVVLSPSGAEGTLSIVSVRETNDIKVVQTLKTEVGSRLGVLDPVSGRVYLPAARFGPPAHTDILPGGEVIPGEVPGTFHFLVVTPVGRTSN